MGITNLQIIFIPYKQRKKLSQRYYSWSMLLIEMAWHGNIFPSYL